MISLSIQTLVYFSIVTNTNAILNDTNKINPETKKRMKKITDRIIHIKNSVSSENEVLRRVFNFVRCDISSLRFASFLIKALISFCK